MASKNKKIIFLIIGLIILLYPAQFLIAYAFKAFVFHPVKLETTSMMPTIKPGERVLVNKFIYRFSSPKSGDVVAFYPPDDATQTKIHIKRIVALENDKIEIISGSVYVNNKKSFEKYVKYRDFTNFNKLTMPKGSYFVMGDNRPNSKDSRVYGPVKRSDVLGKVSITY